MRVLSKASTALIMILMICGMPGSGSDPGATKGQWARVADLSGPPVRGSAAFAVDQYAYIVSGLVDRLIPQVWQYSAASNSWSRKRDFPGTARLDSAGFSIGRKGYFGLGSDNVTGLSDIWEYDTQTDTWTRKRDFPGGARSLATSLVIREKGYVIGGGGRSGLFKDIWEYDSRADRWTRKADFPGVARGAAAGFVIGNKAYYGPGSLRGRPYATTRDFWEYDAQEDRWTRKADFPGAGRGEAIGFALGNKGYICSGMLNLNAEGTSLELARDVWEYDPQNDSWTRQPDLPGSGRAMSMGFAIGSSGYIGGGSREDTLNLSDFWRFSILRRADLGR